MLWSWFVPWLKAWLRATESLMGFVQLSLQSLCSLRSYPCHSRSPKPIFFLVHFVDHLVVSSTTTHPSKLCVPLQSRFFRDVVTLFWQHFLQLFCFGLIIFHHLFIHHPSAFIFVFRLAPSRLPIEPHSSYFFRNFWIPCLAARSFSFSRILTIVGALYLSCQRETILCPLYLLNKAITSRQLRANFVSAHTNFSPTSYKIRSKLMPTSYEVQA